ncbi:MAG: hypothetical protein AB7N76_01500 [Planctomycetota bacterium]
MDDAEQREKFDPRPRLACCALALLGLAFLVAGAALPPQRCPCGHLDPAPYRVWRGLLTSLIGDNLGHQSTETDAAGALRTIASAQALFREGDKDGDGVLDYGTLSELVAAKLLPDYYGGVFRRYRIACGPSRDQPESCFWATAEPVSPGCFGNERSFGTNQVGVVAWVRGPRAEVERGGTCAIGSSMKTDR